MRYTFRSYYKYSFTLTLENGKVIENENQNGDEIYRLGINSEGEATPQDDGTWLVDGVVFREL